MEKSKAPKSILVTVEYEDGSETPLDLKYMIGCGVTGSHENGRGMSIGVQTFEYGTASEFERLATCKTLIETLSPLMPQLAALKMHREETSHTDKEGE